MNLNDLTNDEKYELVNKITKLISCRLNVDVELKKFGSQLGLTSNCIDSSSCILVVFRLRGRSFGYSGFNDINELLNDLLDKNITLQVFKNDFDEPEQINVIEMFGQTIEEILINYDLICQ